MRNSNRSRKLSLRRIEALLMSMCLLMSMLPFEAYAQESSEVIIEEIPESVELPALDDAAAAQASPQPEPTPEPTVIPQPTEAPVVTDDAQAELNNKLEALRPYLEKDSFKIEERQALGDGLEQIGKFCEENNITGLTAEQQELWNKLAQAVLDTPDFAYEAELNSSGEKTLFPTLKEAVEAAQSGDTVTLMKNAVGEVIVIEDSITLDLGGKSYCLREDYANYGDLNCAVAVGADGVTIKNGTITSTVAEFLILNAGELSLEDVKLKCPSVTADRPLVCAVYAIDSYTTFNNCEVSAPGGYGLLMGCENSGAGAELNGGSIKGDLILSGTSSDSATLVLDTDDADLILDINNTEIDGELIVDPGVRRVKVTKTANISVEIPIGYEWKDGTTLALVTDAAKLEYTDDNGASVDVTYDSLEEAVKDAPYGAAVTLLEDTCGRPLTIPHVMTLDLNGHTYSVIGGDEFAVKTNAVEVSALSLDAVVICSSAAEPGVIEFGTDFGYNETALLVAEQDTILENVVLDAPASSADFALKTTAANLTLMAGTVVSGKIFADRYSVSNLILDEAALTDVTLEMEPGEFYGKITKSQEQQVSVPTGFDWVDNELVWNLDVAEVGGVKYTSLSSAVFNAGENDVITMLAATSGESITIDKSLTIDMAGYTYGIIDDDDSSSGIYIEENCQVILKNGTLEYSRILPEREIVLVESSGDLTLCGMTLNGDNDAFWSTVYGYMGSITLENSDDYISEIKAPADGYGIYVYAEDSMAISAEDGTKLSGKIALIASSGDDNLELRLALGDVELKNTVLEFMPGDREFQVAKSADLSLAAPDGYFWDNDTNLIAEEEVAVLEYSYEDPDTGETKTDRKGYSSLEAAINDAGDGDTVYLTKDSSGPALRIYSSITIDMQGNSYTAYYNDDMDAAVFVPDYANVVMINGTLISQDVYALVESSGNLVLSKMKLDATGYAYIAVSACGGSVLFIDGTELSVQEGGLALEMYCNYSDVKLSVYAEDSTTIDGPIYLINYSSNDGVSGNCMSLALNKANVEGPLYIDDPSLNNITVTKNAETKLLPPSGMFWKNDEILLRSVRAEDAIAVSEGDGVNAIIYYDDLQQAVDSSTEVKLLKEVYLEEELVIHRDVTLDLNEKLLYGEGIRITYGNVEIKNGPFTGSTYTDFGSAYIHLQGGNLDLVGVDVGMAAATASGSLDEDINPHNDLPEMGILVEGSGMNPSRLYMMDSELSASYCGVAVVARNKIEDRANINSVTVDSGSVITAELGISDIDVDFGNAVAYGDGEEPVPEKATNIRVYGGLIKAYDTGIEHIVGGDLTFSGGSVQAGYTGILSCSDDNINIYSGASIEIVSGGYERSLGGTGILHRGNGTVNIYGGEITAGYVGIDHESAGVLNISGGTIVSGVSEGDEPTGVGVLSRMLPDDLALEDETESAVGAVNVSGGSIKNYGTAIQVDSNSLDISGGEISNCIGGVEYCSDEVLNISGGTMEVYNCGVYHEGPGSVNVSGGTITAIPVGNYPEGYGIHCTDPSYTDLGDGEDEVGTLTISGGTIDGFNVGVLNECLKLVISGGTIRNCYTGVIHGYNDAVGAGDLTFDGGNIKDCDVGIEFDVEATLNIVSGHIQAVCGIIVYSADLNATGGTVEGSSCALALLSHFAMSDGEPMEATIDGTEFSLVEVDVPDDMDDSSDPVAIVIDDPDDYGVRLFVLTDTVKGPLYINGNINDSTEIYKTRAVQIIPATEIDKPEDSEWQYPYWRDTMEGDLVRLVSGTEPVVDADGIKVTVNWVDDDNTDGTRPEYIDIAIQASAEGVGTGTVGGNELLTTHRIFADDDGGNSWLQYIPTDMSEEFILSVTALSPEGYTAKAELTAEGILVTAELKPEDKGEPTIVYVKRTRTYYVRKERVLYGSSDSLLQTGQLNWPIPVMAVLGTLLLAAGLLMLRKKRGSDHEA